MSAFDDWHTDEVEYRLFYKEPIDIAGEAFNAGRAYQREVDAVIAWSTGMKLFRKKPDEREVGAACAEAIREQKIDD